MLLFHGNSVLLHSARNFGMPQDAGTSMIMLEFRASSQFCHALPIPRLSSNIIPERPRWHFCGFCVQNPWCSTPTSDPSKIILFLRAWSSQPDHLIGGHISNPPDMTVGVRSFTLRGCRLEVETRVGCRSLSWEREEVMAGWIWQVGQANRGGPPISLTHAVGFRMLNSHASHELAPCL